MGVEDCQWFTLEKANDHCILYEECDDQFDCETCATGEKKCAHGYHGTTPAPARAAREAKTNEDGSAVIVGATQSTKWGPGTAPRLFDGLGINGRWYTRGCAGTSDAYKPDKLIERYGAAREWFSLELDAPQKNSPRPNRQEDGLLLGTSQQYPDHYRSL